MKNKVISSVISCFLLLGLTISVAYADKKKVYQVDNIKAGHVLPLRTKPSIHSKVIMELPYDVSWMIRKSWGKDGGQKGERWKKVQWGAHEGWIDSNYMSQDTAASKLAVEHEQCMKKHSQNYLCCGYPASAKASSPIKTYRVTGVARGQSLRVRAAAGVTNAIIATLPHNAVGIVKLPRTKVKIGPSIWEQIRWNGRNGWVNNSYIEFDPIISDYRNIVMDICSTGK